MKSRLGIAVIKPFIVVLVVLAIAVAIIAVVRLDTTAKKGSGLGKEFIYDIKNLVKIDPNLILYKEPAPPIVTGFKSARGIAVSPENHFYVVGDKAIRVFSQNGDLLKEISLNDVPRCLAVTGNGKIYIGLKDHVEVYDTQGKRLASWQSLGNKAVLTSIAVWNPPSQEPGKVFVADAGNRVVIHYDTNGNLVNYIGRKDRDRGIPGFIIPSPYFDLAVAKDGLLRVVNPGRHRIEAYTFGGDLEFWWGKFLTSLEGFTGCCNPVNFAILDDGSFVTCEKGLIRVKLYDPEGNFAGVVAGPEQLAQCGGSHICYLPEKCQAGGFDVAVDKQGRIFVLDTLKNVVRIFTRKKV